MEKGRAGRRKEAQLKLKIRVVESGEARQQTEPDDPDLTFCDELRKERQQAHKRKVDFHNDGVPPLPLPLPYCISQASPIMGFTLRPVTRGGGPAPLLTMAPWGPKRLRCCTVSMPPPPATPPSSTYTARISLRTQVCIRASTSSTLFWESFFFYFVIIIF